MNTASIILIAILIVGITIQTARANVLRKRNEVKKARINGLKIENDYLKSINESTLIDLATSKTREKNIARTLEIDSNKVMGLSKQLSDLKTELELKETQFNEMKDKYINLLASFKVLNHKIK